MSKITWTMILPWWRIEDPTIILIGCPWPSCNYGAMAILVVFFISVLLFVRIGWLFGSVPFIVCIVAP